MIANKTVSAFFCISMLAAAGVQAGGDPARGQELAEDCAVCHGEQGLGDDTFPAIAGMGESAMAEALAGFKSGEKEGDFMPDSVAELSEQDMADVAAYYATLPAPAN